MKKLSLRTKLQKQYLEIPVDFIDEYMPQAPEGAFKVYLYLMRCSLDPSILLSLSDMADLFDVTQKAIIRSLTYWEDCGLLTLEYSGDELTDITLLPFPGEQASSVSENRRDVPENDPESTVIPMPADPEPQPAPKNIHELPKKASAEVNPALLSDLSRDESFTDLLDLAQYYLKKPANSTMRDTLGYCYLLFDRQSDVIEYLLEYCIDLGHTSIHYIRTVADNWKNEGLLDLQSIKAAKALRTKNVTSIMNAFGIRDRSLGTVEMDYISNWTRDFELPIILEACSRTLKKAHSPSFSYANGILSDWKDAGVVTMDDVQKLDENFAKKDKKSSSNSQKKSRDSVPSGKFIERKDDYSDLIRQYYES